MKTKKNLQVTPEQQLKIDRVLNPRIHPFNLRFSKATIELWRSVAKEKGLKITDWVEQTLNSAVRK